MPLGQSLTHVAASQPRQELHKLDERWRLPVLLIMLELLRQLPGVTTPTSGLLQVLSSGCVTFRSTHRSSALTCGNLPPLALTPPWC
eukprot:5274341-Amphidinium_carterae.1